MTQPVIPATQTSPVPEPIGGARDIMAQRSGCTKAAGAFDQADELLRFVCTSFAGYTQQQFEDMGNSVDGAYYLADTLPKILTILETSADWKLVRDFANDCRNL